MIVLTAIESLRIEAKNNKMNELKKIVDFIEIATSEQEEWEGQSQHILNNIDIDINEMEILVDIDELHFKIDGESFEAFCNKNFIGNFNSDKQFRIKGISL
jgi:hypothetical protein|tara:strand:- start:308 stop:610 length:303 start_codon:yes stop_codon:yes gene_type:complete